MSRILTPIHVDNCSCGRYATRATDGLTETFRCANCRELLADLMVHAEL